jgi:hypothetical protein
MAKSHDKTLDLELHQEVTAAADAPLAAKQPSASKYVDLPVVGEITLRFYDSEAGGLVPEVSFRPLGRINPNTIEKHLPFIYREIQRQQVIERKRQ